MPKIARYEPVTPQVISPFYLHPVVNPKRYPGGAAPFSTTWLTANMAILWPLYIPETCLATAMWWVNGATVSGHVDAGIYDGEGNRLVSTGSTVPTPVSTLQQVTISKQLPAGLVYMALACDNTTQTFWQDGTLENTPEQLAYQVATSFPLPATITFATQVSGNNRVVKFGATISPRTIA